MKTLKILVGITLFNSLLIYAMDTEQLTPEMKLAFLVGLFDATKKSENLTTKVITDPKAVFVKDRIKKATIARLLPYKTMFASIYSSLLVESPSNYSYTGAATNLTLKDTYVMGIRTVNPVKKSSLVILEHLSLLSKELFDHHTDVSGANGPFKGTYITSVEDCNSSCINFYDQENSEKNLEHLSVETVAYLSNGQKKYSYPQPYLVCDFKNIVEYLLKMLSSAIKKGDSSWKNFSGFYITALGENNNFTPTDITQASLLCADGSLQTFLPLQSLHQEAANPEKNTKHTVILFTDKVSEVDISI